MPIIGYNLDGNATLVLDKTSGFHHEEAIYGYTAVAGDFVDEMFFRGDDNGMGGSTVELAVYDVIAGVITNMVGASQIIAGIAGLAWYSTGAINIPLVAGTIYTIAQAYNGNTRQRVQTGLANHIHELRPANPLPDPWTAGGVLRGWVNSAYANVSNFLPPAGGQIIFPCCAQLIT